jgi:hypothetical protein
MRRQALAHRLFPLSTAASLVLCAATVAAWARSSYVHDIISFGRAGGWSHTVQSISGRLHLLIDETGPLASGGLSHRSGRLVANTIWDGAMSGYPMRPAWHFGIIWQRYTRVRMALEVGEAPYVSSYRLIVLPYRWMATAFAIPPAVYMWWLLMAWRRSRRSPRSTCPACGYDLRATPHRCPECGAAAGPDQPSFA